ncbi:MAG: hypothetical protein UCH28_10090 [Adlercreutzia sp.]|nr:hypothetical protein [Adlercreutzia sp.]
MKPITRRTACQWGVAALAVLAFPSLGALEGCTPASPARASACALAFSPALGESYEAACAAAAEKADDAKLMAVRSTSFSFADAEPGWMYLFYSWERASAYTVFVTGTTATAGETGNLAITQEEFDALPAVTALAWDADGAYQQITNVLEGDEEFLTCRAYLMTYDETSEDALVWFFSFNEADDVASYLGEVEAASPIAPAQVWAVDAQSGEATRVSIEEADDDENSEETEDSDTDAGTTKSDTDAETLGAESAAVEA